MSDIELCYESDKENVLPSSPESVSANDENVTREEKRNSPTSSSSRHVRITKKKNFRLVMQLSKTVAQLEHRVKQLEDELQEKRTPIQNEQVKNVDQIDFDALREDLKKKNVLELTEQFFKKNDLNPTNIDEMNVALDALYAERNSLEEERRRLKFQLSVPSKRPQRPCEYCNRMSHWPDCCALVPTSEERRHVMQQKGLCEKCSGPRHVKICRPDDVCRVCKSSAHRAKTCPRRVEAVNRSKDLPHLVDDFSTVISILHVSARGRATSKGSGM